MANGPSVDGVLPPSEPTPELVQSTEKSATPAADKSVRTWKLLLTAAGFFAYTLYIGWCSLLLLTLPSQEDMSGLVMTGLASCALAGFATLGIGALVFMHIAKTKATPRAKQIALIKLIVVVIPALLLSAYTPYAITREPALILNITSPATAAELIAPIPVTFNAQQAVDTLAVRGFRPVKYRWDVNGDKQFDQETFDPTLIVNFDREGIYTVTVGIVGADNTQRTASRRLIINNAVFAVTPSPAIIDSPAVFDISNLFPTASTVRLVQWDFDGDGQNDSEGPELQQSYTYLRTGTFNAVVKVQLTNNTQTSYTRTVSVQEPPELPFPVTVETQPKMLIGSAPFSALFEVKTEEPIFNVEWNFGNGQRSEGLRATQTFRSNGTYAVQARVRSQSGVIANVTTLVKVVDRLDVPDLRYDGSPLPVGNKITGEVPLTLDLTPTTTKPFITFSWEAPDATEIGSTDTRLQAIYRRPGTYTVTLIGQDLDNHVLRQPITVEVKPASSLVTFRMEPESGVAPLTVKFDASESTIPGQDITGFIWNFGDGSPDELIGAVAQHTYTRPGNYVVSVTARTTTGSERSDTKTISVRAPTMQARILASRLTGQSPLTVVFSGAGSTGNPTSYLWNFGDGTENDGVETTHTFTQPGNYNVLLTTTDGSGKTSSTTVTINVQ